MTDSVLVLGASGVFGSRLVILLEREGIKVLKAGRSGPVVLDRDSPEFEAHLAELSPAVVVDAAGPFQSYGADPFRVAKAALAAGAHYLDLSDDAAFTTGISALDDLARAQGLTCLSGVSSVPALSSAAVEVLGDGMEIDLISAAIMPGNRAPRGLSLMRAILAQTGQPLRLWRGGEWGEAKGWGESQRFRLTAMGKSISRYASLIGAPDLHLFPERYGARSVEFRAGLELELLHRGLASLGWLVRLRLVRSLVPLARVLRHVSGWFLRLGTDRGGMIVLLRGLVAGQLVERRWTLIAEQGDGPMIPAIPALIMSRAVLAGRTPPGARAALGVFPLGEAESELTKLSVVTERAEQPFPTVFGDGLGTRFAELPTQIADLHTVLSRRIWKGRAEVTRGRSLLARLAGFVMRFPPENADVAVSVTMDRHDAKEVWTRDFGGRKFRSHLTSRPGRGVRERFGALSFDIDLGVEADALHYPVSRGYCLGLPLPRFLLPLSQSREFVDDQGRACFDVSLSHPLSGLVVRYRGWLEAI